MEQNKQFGIGTNDEMSAVTFGLYAGEELTAKDGKVIPADGLVEIISVDENGKGKKPSPTCLSAITISKKSAPTSTMS